MEYQFKNQDQVYPVKLDRSLNEHQQAQVNKETIEFDFKVIADNCYSIIVAEKSYTAYYAKADGRINVSIQNEQYEFDDLSQKKDSAHTSRQHDELAADKEVRAPMPGKLLKILVTEQEQVRIKQPLFIVESMKMENQVTAQIAGRVAKINHKVNDLVSTGDVILELEKEELS